MTDGVRAAFQRAARLEEIGAATPLALRLDDGARVCLVRDGSQVYAFADRCPHRDFPLSGDDLVEPCVIECPWHGARFDVRTGEVLQGPATDPLIMYAVRVVEGDVFVASLSQSARPMVNQSLELSPAQAPESLQNPLRGA